MISSYLLVTNNNITKFNYKEIYYNFNNIKYYLNELIEPFKLSLKTLKSKLLFIKE